MELRPKDLYIVLEYLRRGGKVKIEGRTYVWLDNYITHETDTHIFSIDGLAIETRSYSAGEDWMDPNSGTLFYMGCKDMTLHGFINLINIMDFAEFTRICQELKAQLDKEGQTHI